MTQESWFPNRSDRKWPVQSQEKARSSEFQIQEEEELYYPCSGNKYAVQLCRADLGLCFRLGKIWFYHDTAHVICCRHNSSHVVMGLITSATLQVA